MDADTVTAGTAAIALILSFIGLLWQRRSSEDRKTWEAEQDRTRNRWAKEQQDDQNRWQEEQTRKQVKRENSWRQEENERLATWRAEDIARQEDLTKPKLDVKLNPGFQMNQVSGLSETMLFTEARNVGVVPVYFSNWGGFALPDDKSLDLPQAVNPSKYGTDYDFRQPLAPTSSCKTYVELNTFRGWLAENGFTGIIEVQGYFTDRLGTRHLSNTFPVNMEDD